jgi:putative N6-adenine-specific DNA methylase
MVDAPLKETLAAAVLALGRVAPERPFVDPMAGSGTLAIEHALTARRIAPGLGRLFGFERWPGRPHARHWEALKGQARQTVAATAPASISARDLSADAVAAARRNAAAAGVESDIDFAVADIADLRLAGAPGTLCMNPPYGERLAPRDLEALYDRIAAAVRRQAGWAAVILCGNPALERALGGRPAISHRLWNGPLEARLLRYE